MEYLKGFVWSHSFLQCANGLHLALKIGKLLCMPTVPLFAFHLEQLMTNRAIN